MASFQVQRDRPYYLLRNPEGSVKSFPETLGSINGNAATSIDLASGMVLKIENAYYKEGAPKRGIANFVGTEKLSYQVQKNGRLQQAELNSLAGRPADQSAVTALVLIGNQRKSYHRFYFQVVLNRNSGASNAVLLSANSSLDLENLAKRMAAEPASVCGAQTRECTVFPEACSVSISIEISVNGKRSAVPWGSQLSSIVGSEKRFVLRRWHRSRQVQVDINPQDLEALRLPLLQGDEITW